MEKKITNNINISENTDKSILAEISISENAKSFLQNFQDKFSKMIELSCVIMKDNRFFTKPSNFKTYCNYKKCLFNGKTQSCCCQILKQNSDKIEFYTCAAGLTHFSVPIIISDDTKFTFIAGQILTKYPTTQQIKEITSDLNISEYEYKELISKAKTISEQQFKEIANFLTYIINDELIKEKHTEIVAIEKEKLLTELLSACIENLDYKKLVKNIVSKTGKFFDADRCFFVEHDRTSTHNKPIKKYAEYLSADDIKSHLEVSTINDSKYFVKKSRSKFISVVDDTKNAVIAEEAKKMLTELSVKSYVIMPVYYKNIVYGSLVLHYVKDYKHFTKAETNLMKAIANNFAIVIGQSELYSKLLEQISREKTILTNLPFEIWLKDKHGRYIAINKAFMKNYKKNEEEIIGETDYAFMPYEVAKIRTMKDTEIIKNNKILHEEESYNYEKIQVWKEVYNAPFYDEKGKIAGTIGFSFDITDKKEMERMKNEFVSMVSHELRTPLTVINGTIGLLLNGLIRVNPEKSQELLEMANNNCDRLAKLINNILDISKIETGQMDFSVEKVDLISTVNRALLINKPFADKYGAKLELNSEFEHLEIKIDADRLVQVLNNLLSNAIKFSKKDSAITVSIEKRDEKTRISVTNYGKDIPENFKDKIFARFTQCDSSDSRQKGGTGLGLNIAKMLIEKMNGTIDFISQSGLTTFYVEF